MKENVVLSQSDWDALSKLASGLVSHSWVVTTEQVDRLKACGFLDPVLGGYVASARGREALLSRRAALLSGTN